jgi:signal transduction histidine kinase
MRIRFRAVSFLFVSILLLLAAVTVLLFSVIGSEIRTGSLLAQYRAEQTAFALFETYRDREAELEEQIRRDETLLGFGVYDASGQPLYRFGTAPPQVDPETVYTPTPRFLREEKAGTLILVRPVGMGPEMMGPGTGSGMRRMMGRTPRFGRLIYLEMATQELFRSGRLLRTARFLLPAALLLILGLFIYLYRLNVGYQKRIESHERLVRLGEAARTLAHEIRNPLGAVRIQTGYLKRILPEAARGELQVIDEEVQRLDLLVNRISDFLRDPRGNPQTVDLDPFIRRLAGRYEGGIDYQNLAGGPVAVSFDPDRLRSVLENLIANARESMAADGADPAGEPAAPREDRRVEVRLQRLKGRAILSILDRGRGLPAGWRKEELFDPFFTTKTRGSGIGLSLCRRFVEEAGGRIELLERSGGGVEARITLKETPEASEAGR